MSILRRTMLRNLLVCRSMGWSSLPTVPPWTHADAALMGGDHLLRRGFSNAGDMPPSGSLLLTPSRGGTDEPIPVDLEQPALPRGHRPSGLPAGARPVRRGTYGNCQTYICKDGRDVTPSLTQRHPEIEQPSDQLPTDQSCTELIASVPQIVFANLTAACCALNAMYRYLCGGPDLGEVAFDIC